MDGRNTGLDRILRDQELDSVTGVSRATRYRWIKDGLFPAPVKLGPNSVGWRESVIREWLESRETVGAGAASISKNGEPGGAP